jgi:hypothetical protein
MRPSEPIAIPQQKSKGFEQNNGSPLEEQRSYGTPDDTLTGQMDATFSDSDVCNYLPFEKKLIIWVF